MAVSVDQVYRDYNTQGVPASGDHKPIKAEIRALLKGIQNSSGLSVTRNTFTALQGVTPPTENYMGIVLDDTDPTKNGYYSRVAAAWVWERGFPDTFAKLTLAGVSTARTAVVAGGVNPADIEVFFGVVNADNVGAITLSVSGGAARDVVNANGSALTAGEWTGVVQFFLNDDGDYQLINDAGAAASAAASAAAAAAALDAVLEGSIPDNGTSEAKLASSLTLRLTNACASRAVLKAVNALRWNVAYLAEAGREGTFVWRDGDYASSIAADTNEGIYIKADAIAATDGAWVRDFQGAAMVTWWGADKTGVADCGSILGGIFGLTEVQWLHFPKGEYNVATLPAECNHDIRITGDGYGSHIDFSAGSAYFRLYGSATALPALAAYMRTDRDYASFATAHGLAVGDLFLAFKPADDSYFNVPSRNYKQAEFFTVYKVDSSTQVSIFGRPHDLYSADATTEMYKVSPIRVQLDGFRVTEGAAGVAIHTKWGRGVRCSNVHTKASTLVAIEFDRCFDGVVTVSATNSATTSDMYGLSINSCTDFVIDGGSPAAGRHSIALGAREETGAGPNRNIRIVNVTLANATNSIGAADMHGCVEGISYDNCKMVGGAIMAGKNVSIRNSEIWQIPGATEGYGVYGSEIAGGTYTLENNVFRIHDRTLSRGFVLISPGDNMLLPLLLVARNNTIVNTLGYDDTEAANTRIFCVECRDSNEATNVLIDGIVSMVTNVAAILRVNDLVAVAVTSDFLAVDNPLVKAGGTKYIIEPTSKIAAVKTREYGTQGVGGGASVAWPN